MFARLGQLVTHRWNWIIAAWAALAVAVVALLPNWDDVTHDGDLAYLPEQVTSVRGDRLLREAFPELTAKSQLVFVIARKTERLSGDDLDALERLARRFSTESPQELPINKIWTPRTEVIGGKLISADRQAALAVLHLDSEFVAVRSIGVLRRIYDEVAEFRRQETLPAGLELGITGSAAVGGDVLTATAQSVSNIELTTILLVLGILLAIYRAPGLVIVPLITIAVSVLVATGIVAGLTQVQRIPGWEWFDLKVFTTTKIFVTTILYGSGTDFCLFLVARFREELARGLIPRLALSQALSQIGQAVTASAMTTILGLSVMFFADFGKLRNSGPVLGLCLLICLIACLTLAPALMRALGRGVFWPGRVDKFWNQTGSPGGDRRWATSFWQRTADVVLARPGLVLLASVILMAPLTYRGLLTPVSYNLLEELGPTWPSVRGKDILQRHFAPGETAPLTIVVQQSGAQFDTPACRAQIDSLTRALNHAIDDQGPEALQGAVVSVRSATDPLGEGAEPAESASDITRQAVRNKRAQKMYVSIEPRFKGEVTLFQLLLRFDPFMPEALDSVAALDDYLQRLARNSDSPWHGAQFELTGISAGMRDLRAVMDHDQRLIERLVVIAVLGVLIVLLRRPGICLYLIASVMVSYYVTLGATELLFGWWYSGNFSGLDWKVPLFLFVILVAVGVDYNIYLVSRVIEEQKHGSQIDSLRQAMITTGGIITSCGIIMAGTFVSMMSGSLRGILELGFALTLGVMLDTMIVRPILVPAMLAMVYRRRESISVQN